MSGAESAGETLMQAMGVVYLLGCVIAIALLYRAVSDPPPWRRRIRMIEHRPWHPLDVVLVLGVVAAGQILAGLMPPPDLHSHSLRSFAGFVLLSLLTFHGAAALGVWALFRLRQTDWRHSFGVRQGYASRDVLFAVVAFLAAFPLTNMIAFFSNLLLKLLGREQTLQEVVTMVAGPDQSVAIRVYLCVLAIVIAPVVEEIVFRGMALPVLSRYIGFPAAVVVVSAVFALIHGHAPSLAPLFAIAVAFSFGYALTGSLRVPIVMHAVFNAVNLLAAFFTPDTAGGAAP